MGPSRVAGRRAIAAAALAVCGACGDPEQPGEPWDLLLVTIDTARADRFSYTGATAPGTPRVDALAAEGAGFLQAIAPTPLTLPSHASLLTGRLPPSHTVRDNGTYRLPDGETTLGEVLAESGYATGAFVGAQVLDARYGLDQGFSTYDDEIADPGGASPFRNYAERNGEEVVAAATRWLDARGAEPVFAWVHLFDPHAPYGPPEPERSRHASRYDGEIAYADRVVGDLLDHWRERRGLDRTLVVVTSDHGEGLGEHGEPTHGVLVHDETLRVPLVIRAPGLRVEQPIDSPVSLIDVLPTVLALLGLPFPENVEGRDLSPLLRGGSVAWSRPSGYAESLYARLHHDCAPLHALREDGWKLVRGHVDELYDLASDPGELHDRAAGHARRVAEMGDALEDLRSGAAAAGAERMTLDEETRRALESLGYVASGPATVGRGDGLRDPREALVSLREMAEADRSLLRGDPEDAIARYRAVIDREPASVDARFRLAQILRSRERAAEAVELLSGALAINPDEPFLYASLGETLQEIGRYEESLAALEAGLARHPESRRLRDGRWRCLNQLSRHDLLLADAERAVHADPGDGFARYARALSCCGQGAVEDYVAALERELAELPGDPLLERELARARGEAADP